MLQETRKGTMQGNPRLTAQEGPNVWQLPLFICLENIVILQHACICAPYKEKNNNYMNYWNIYECIYWRIYTWRDCTRIAGLFQISTCTVWNIFSFIYWDKSHPGFKFSFSALAYEDSLIVLFVFYFKRALLHNYPNYSCLYLDVESLFNVSIFCFS